MRQAYLTSLILLGILTGISIQSANAQLAANKAFLLEGNGFAISDNSILTATIDLQFIITKKGTTSEFTLQNGLIDINGKDLAVSGFSGTILKNGQFFKISSDILDSVGKKFTFRALGNLMEKNQDNSIYSVTATLSDSSNKITKLIYTTKVSEFTPIKPADKNKKTETIIHILKGSSNPKSQTYKEQIGGFLFNYFSENRISIISGGTVTFVNNDIVSHSLKSGISNNYDKTFKQAFTADGKISSGDIKPGKSWSATFKEPGFYRIFDEKYQWMDATIFVSSDSSSKTIGSSKNPRN
jgi:plastocyanin